MRKAVTQLGIDPIHHQVELKPHQLLIFGPGTGDTSYTLKIEEKPTGYLIIYFYFLSESQSLNG